MCWCWSTSFYLTTPAKPAWRESKTLTLLKICILQVLGTAMDLVSEDGCVLVLEYEFLPDFPSIARFFFGGRARY